MLFVYRIISLIIPMLMLTYNNQSIASTLSVVSITNNVNKATIVLDSNIIPMYTIFSLHNPERIVIDFSKISRIQKNIFPIRSNTTNLVKSIRVNFSKDIRKNGRLVLDLASSAYIESIMQKKVEKKYRLVLTVLKKNMSIASSDNIHRMISSMDDKKHSCFVSNIIVKTVSKIRFDNNMLWSSNNNRTKKSTCAITIAIDAGHGGQDPGAMGFRGIYEKNITIDIAKKLKNFLDSDPMFKTVMIRDGDYFLSVMERSELARKRRANFLISIHVDSTVNTSVKGASIWILSNSRVKREMTHWLERREKHAELLGGAGDILTNYQDDPYFNHLVLDLQFGYSQKVGYDIAMQVLHQLKSANVFLHKKIPEYSSFGILRAPDIPSILVETGFISNVKEACLLSSSAYQEKLAKAVYQGVKSYFVAQSKQLLTYSESDNIYIVNKS